jgi:hypothetical protein
MYARKLTKEELMEQGISEVTKTGKVFKNGVEVKPQRTGQGYLMFYIYELDENGNRIKMPCPSGYYYKQRTIGLHRIMWAWYFGEVPEGMIVDHINNRHECIEDYYLDNLQLLTSRENVIKERDNCNIKELKCNLSKPRSFYEDKLAYYTEKYEEAKKNHDAKAAHKYRCNLSQVRARIRYYDNNISEVNERRFKADEDAQRKFDYHENAKKRRELKKEIDSARKYWKAAREAYGKDDEYVLKLWGEWKLAIAKYYGKNMQN